MADGTSNGISYNAAASIKSTDETRVFAMADAAVRGISNNTSYVFRQIPSIVVNTSMVLAT